MANNQESSECWLDKYLYQTIGRLYYELTQVREELVRYKGFFENRKAQCQELQEQNYKLRDIEWECVRLKQKLKEAGISDESTGGEKDG